MTKSKRKRYYHMFRQIANDQLGENFFLNLKHHANLTLVDELNDLSNRINFQHSLLSEKGKAEANEKKRNWIYQQHAYLVRTYLVEAITIVDTNIGQALFHYQTRKMNISLENVKEFSRPEIGMKECFKGQKIPKELDTFRHELNMFRKLRHQFAHYRYGTFFLNANDESFESFLQKSEGIDFKDTYHCLIDGKPGVYIPYGISSSKFMESFNETSRHFMKMFLEFMFPTEKDPLHSFDS